MSSTNTLRVLIVEDEPTDAVILRRSLERLEVATMEITVAETGARAKSMLAKTEFDLVLLDLHLPDVVGFELVQQVKQSRPHLPVIVCTSINSDEAALEVGKMGADDFIVKDDLLTSSLGRTVRRLLRHRFQDLPAGTSRPKLLDEGSDQIDTWLAWRFPESLVPRKDPPADVLLQLREKFQALLEGANAMRENELHRAMKEFEDFAFEIRIPAETLIGLHRAWGKERKFSEAISGKNRYLLFELLAALLERYRLMEEASSG